MSNRPGTAVPAATDAATIGHTLTDHPAPRWLVLQRGLFTGPNMQVAADLYAQIKSGKAHRERDVLNLEKGATVHTNTYFGRFPASYFQRWTTVEEVRVTFSHHARGTCRALLRACDYGGNARTVRAIDFSGTGEATMSTPLREYLDGGALWVEFTAVECSLTITDLVWTASAPPRIRPAAVSICTFNRPAECAATIAAIANDPALAADIDAVYVVDQGTDHVSSQALFQEDAAKLGGKLVYIRQPNLGGAGGFSRGMYEISAIGEHANVILMDDDILCEPDTVLRLNAFANLTSAPTIVGAQMLYLMNPACLHVGAEGVELSKIRAGWLAPNALHNANMITKHQNRRVDAGYNGWWTCLIPAEVIADIGLPLPIFIKWDDVEYGLRAGRAGYPTVTLPNAGVWHVDFFWKNRDDWVDYFSVRNSLIVAALYSDLDAAEVCKRLAREVAQCVVSMQYGLAATVLDGIEGFLAGPQTLHDGGPESLGAVRALRARYPDTITHPPSRVPGIRDTDLVMRPSGYPPKKDRLDLVLAKRVLAQWRGRTQHGIADIRVEDAHWWHVGLFDHAVVTHSSQSGVRIRKRDKRTIRELTSRAFKLMRRMRAEAATVQQQYREAMPVLTGRANWQRLFVAESDR